MKENTKKNNLNRLLVADKDFVPLPEEADDELFRNGIFIFNITKMIKYIKDNPLIFIPERLTVKDYPACFSNINESYIDSVKSIEPVILAEISPGRYSLIDGNHRMEKARRTGTEYVMGYRLNVHHHINFLTTKKAYYAYVEYWNGKVQDMM